MKYDPRVTVLWATPDPASAVANAARLTQMNPYKDAATGTPTEGLIKYLYTAGHRSVFQHAVMSVRMYNISRSCADQVRTAHHLSITSTSQHYKDHSDFPFFCDDDDVAVQCLRSREAYAEMVNDGKPKEEARQCLPMAMGASIIVTGNAQAWANFLHTRMCRRNVQEMILLAMRMDSILSDWFPELFMHVGPQCFEDKCKQGRMSCGNPYCVDLHSKNVYMQRMSNNTRVAG